MIARLLSFTRVVRNGAKFDDVKADPGGGQNVTGEHFAQPGDDSVPLPTDYVLLVRVQRSGGYAAAGYIDPLNAGAAAPGERRLYSRDGDGAPVATVWLKNNGSVVLANDNGYLELTATGAIRGENGAGFFELETSGDFVANDAKLTADGDVVTSDDISLRSHVHGGVTVGTGVSGGPQ